MATIKIRAWHFGHKRMFSAEEMTIDQLALLPNGLFANIHSEDTRLSKIYSHDEMLPLLYSGFNDKNGTEIYQGDLVGLKNGAGKDIIAICKYGSSIRCLNGVDVEIIGFYFDVSCHHSFPIVKNYQGIHDTQIFEVIGNVYENPELIPGAG